jgi:acylglycerol lipase
VPFIVFHSDADTMTDPAGSQLLYDAAASRDKALKRVNGMWHLLTKEPGNDAVLAECVAWVAARCAKKGGK